MASNCLRMDHTLANFKRYELLSSLNFGPVTDGQTDGRKVMHMSPPCICTGVLKNFILVTHYNLKGHARLIARPLIDTTEHGPTEFISKTV